MKKNNLTIVLSKFAKNLNLVIDINKVHEELLIHPDYPNLLAVSDVLLNFAIPTAAYRVSVDDLGKAPLPFIALTNAEKGDLLMVHAVNGDHLVVSDEKWNRHNLSIKSFKPIFNGVVLTAETAVTGPVSKRIRIAGMARPIAAGLLLLIITAAISLNTNFKTNFNWHIALFMFAKAAGLAVSTLLLVQSIDSHNPLIQSICKTGGKTGCNDILSSEAAKIVAGLSWSEVGFFYFASTFLFLLLNAASAGSIQILAILNLVGLPYTGYSIFFQARIARSWCVLCCAVQALLWIEFASTISLLHFSGLPLVTAQQVSLLALAIALPVVTWVFLKPTLLHAHQIHSLKFQLQKFKFNNEIFNTTLSNQARYAQPEKDWTIVLGNTESSNVITMISNPYCSPCAKTHKALHELLKTRPDLQARVVFTASRNENDPRTPVSRHLMTLNGLSDKNIVKQALFDWYEQKQRSYERWAKAYPVEPNSSGLGQMDMQIAWCSIVAVTETPTILLNGYRLPPWYQINDLKYMLQ